MRRIRGALSRLLDPSPTPERRDKHLWSIGIYTGRSPLDLGPDAAIPCPVLTRDDVTDVSASLVADPFLQLVDGTWHLFFEVLNRATNRGEIALATSRDLASWRYQHVVLREPFHLSYPHVFEWKGEHFMIPETHETRTVRLYRAAEFPSRWQLAHTLLSGERFADSTLLRHDDRWWLFTETSPEMKHDTLRLYHADDLFGAWTEHSASPIVSADPHRARPGGPCVRAGGRLFRFAQDCAPRYGIGLSAFEITKLGVDVYEERAAAEYPLLGPSGSGWNESGMHHADAHELSPDRWVAAVDGWRAATASEIRGSA